MDIFDNFDFSLIGTKPFDHKITYKNEENQRIVAYSQWINENKEGFLPIRLVLKIWYCGEIKFYALQWHNNEKMNSFFWGVYNITLEDLEKTIKNEFSKQISNHSPIMTISLRCPQEEVDLMEKCLGNTLI